MASQINYTLNQGQQEPHFQPIFTPLPQARIQNRQEQYLNENEKRTMTRELHSSKNARGYFPGNIADLFGLPESSFGFLGIREEETRETESGTLIKISQDYVAVLGYNLPEELRELSFFDSKRKWIKREGYEFEALRKDQDLRASTNILGATPLLVLRIINYAQHAEHPYALRELLRYADHEQFRKRGIAAAVLESVERKVAEEGTQFLYVNYHWSAWPKKSAVIPVGYSSEKLKKEIWDCLPPDYRLDKFEERFQRQGFFKVLDLVRNQEEHERAMEK